MQTWIRGKDIVALLRRLGFSEQKGAGSHVILRHEQSGNTVVVPGGDRELGTGMLHSIQKIVSTSGVMSNREFANFVAGKSAFTGKFLQAEEEDPPELHKEVSDRALRERLQRLGDCPLDTLIREAGVVLEDRLRKVSGETDETLHGVTLVDAVMTPGKAKIVFSSHPGEQDGARMLYRGAIQFIRNPAMHKLIDYRETEAKLFINVIDSLLRLLEEPKSP